MITYRLAPELIVADLAASLRFWCDLIGFRVDYDRPEDGFAFLSQGPVFVMLEQADLAKRSWLTAELERPLGRGVNFEITLPDIQPCLDGLAEAAWPLFMAPEIKAYRVAGRQRSVRQFLVQDPDGYLLRLAETVSED